MSRWDVGEYLKWGGAVVQEWLLMVLNAVEVVPSILKSSSYDCAIL